MPVFAFEQLPEAMEVIKQRAEEKKASLTVLHADQISRLNDVEIGK